MKCEECKHLGAICHHCRFARLVQRDCPFCGKRMFHTKTGAAQQYPDRYDCKECDYCLKTNDTPQKHGGSIIGTNHEA